MKRTVLLTFILFTAIWCKTHKDSDTGLNMKTGESHSLKTAPVVTTPTEAANAVIDASKDFANSTCASDDTQCQSLQSAASMIADADAATLTPYMNSETLNAMSSNVTTDSMTNISTSTSTNVSTGTKTNPYLGLEIALPLVTVGLFAMTMVVVSRKKTDLNMLDLSQIYKDLQEAFPEQYVLENGRLDPKNKQYDWVDFIASHLMGASVDLNLIFNGKNFTNTVEHVFVLLIMNNYLEKMRNGLNDADIEKKILANKKAIIGLLADKNVLEELLKQKIPNYSPSFKISDISQMAFSDGEAYKILIHGTRPIRDSLETRIQNLTESEVQQIVTLLLAKEKDVPKIENMLTNLRQKNPNFLPQIEGIANTHFPVISEVIRNRIEIEAKKGIPAHFKLTEDTQSPKNIYIQTLIKIAKQIQKFKH